MKEMVHSVTGGRGSFIDTTAKNTTDGEEAISFCNRAPFTQQMFSNPGIFHEVLEQYEGISGGSRNKSRKGKSKKGKSKKGKSRSRR